MVLANTTNEKKCWDFFRSKGLNDYACAGILGNAYAESGLHSNNLQNTYEKTLGMSDETYTQAVDNGTYTNFVKDFAGYGLFQFTYWTLKQGLLDYAKKTGRSIGNLDMQLEYTWSLWTSNYTTMVNTLRSAKSVREASDAVMLKFECPYDQSEPARSNRAQIGEKFYAKFACSTSAGGAISMGYITCTKGKNTKLSEYFGSTEMDCHGSGCCSQTIINETLVTYLTKIREHFGKPITITSGYRCVTHNKNVGGATGSRHGKGDAADIVVSGVSPRVVAQYAESIGILGIGLYETSADGHFVHIDTRNYKSFWYGQSQQARTTFGTYTGTSSSGTSGSYTTIVNTNSAVLTGGCSGEAVKALQQKLIALGYSCGKYGADGYYGDGTRNAVREFQKKAGLTQDGIAGYLTQTAIDKAASAATSSNKQVKTTADILNVRSGAGTNYPVVSGLRKGSVCVVVEESNGFGRILSPAGWISSQYYETV